MSNKLRTSFRREQTAPGPVTIIQGPLPLHDGGTKGGWNKGRPAAPTSAVREGRARIVPAGGPAIDGNLI